MIPHIIRPAKSADEGYIFDSWLRSMAHDLSIPDDDGERRRFWRAQKLVVAACLKHGKTLVACSRLDQDEIMGWACAEPPGLLHFVVVKGGCQRQGLCRELVKALGMAPAAKASHHTARGFPRVRRCFESLELDVMASEGDAA